MSYESTLHLFELQKAAQLIVTVNAQRKEQLLAFVILVLSVIASKILYEYSMTFAFHDSLL